VFLSTYSGRDTVTKIIPARLKGAADSEVRAVSTAHSAALPQHAPHFKRLEFNAQVKRHQNKHIHVVTVYTAFTGTPCAADAAALPVGATAPNDVVLVMERCLADLHDLLLQNKGGIGESTFVREWVMQLAHGTYGAAICAVQCSGSKAALNLSVFRSNSLSSCTRYCTSGYKARKCAYFVSRRAASYQQRQRVRRQRQQPAAAVARICF